MQPYGISEPASSAAWPAQDDVRAFHENAPCGYLTMRRQGTIVGANRTLLKWVSNGVAAAEGDLHLRDILTPASWAFFGIKCAPVLAMHGRVSEIALDLRRPDRSSIPVLASFQVAHDTAEEQEPLIRGILLDVTERRLYERDLLAAKKAAEEARRAAEEAGARLSAILESTTDGVLLVGPDWRVSYANPRAADFRAAPWTGEDLRKAFPVDRDGAFQGAFLRAMAGEAGEGVHGFVGAAVWLWVSAYPAPGGGMAVFFRDTTQERRAAEERQRTAKQIEHLATHDALTGLPNRRLFASRLRDALASRDGPLAILCLDLDRFKQVNDRLGHPAGDALLKAVAGRLRSELRAKDTVARFGGDEFAVLLAPDKGASPTQREAQAEEVAARIVRKLSTPYAINGERAEIGTSVGITVASGQVRDPEALLAEADLALYQAKRGGRGRHATFRPAMMCEHRTRLEDGDALRQALGKGELLLHYQPLVNVANRQVCGHEALVRWNRQGHGLVLPTSFVPLAEEVGLIFRLGAFVLDRACHDAAAWPGMGLRVAVNISPIQFRDPDLVDVVAAALSDSGLPPDRLELEITEGVLLERTEEVLAIMHRLRKLGVGFALDDFGTGFSSLAYLRSFPFDRVKIDGSFMREIETSDRDAAIIESVAGLCRSLGMTCLAEGVETEGHLRLLARAGCDEAQGYLFGRPVPQAEVLRLAAGA